VKQKSVGLPAFKVMVGGGSLETTIAALPVIDEAIHPLPSVSDDTV
jgi:hypothetical protein